jgi:hypothetical protein
MTCYSILFIDIDQWILFDDLQEVSKIIRDPKLSSKLNWLFFIRGNQTNGDMALHPYFRAHIDPLCW